MREKIGIITFHTALNYGAVLQTYALQTFLTSIGFDNEIIDYRCPYIEKCYKPFFVSDGQFLNSIIRGFLFGKIIKNKKVTFKKFVNEKLILSEAFFSVEELKEIRNKYKYFITGSDQVWSPISAGFDIAYFLPFANNNQKYSYAASIGTADLTENEINEFRNRLSNFNIISLRENSAVQLFERIDSSKKTKVHVDPTLLLTKAQWMSLIEEPRVKEPYILIFNVEKCINDLAFAKKIAKERNLIIVYINERTLIEDKEIIYFKAPTPEEFLNLFVKASVVVTNSFHGTVFSLIFEKDFYVELNNKRQRNIRVAGLLDMVKIENREILDTYETDNYSEINWIVVRNILDEQRKKSLEYLKEIDNAHV